MVDTYLHSTKAGADKVYSLHVRQTDHQRWAVIGYYGARNTDLQTRGASRVYYTRNEAISDLDAFSLKKQREGGYVVVSQVVVFPKGLDPLVSLQIVPDFEVVARLSTKQGGPARAPRAKSRPSATTPPSTPTYTPPQPPPKRNPTPSSSSNLPAIPAWILACFAEIPAPSRPKAADILALLFPEQSKLIALGAVSPEARTVDWMRAMFLRTPLDSRKQLYRQFQKIVHQDCSGNEELSKRWNETYERCSPK
jgi:hypothetical protein